MDKSTNDDCGDQSSIDLKSNRNSETYQRSYNHLINEKADNDIFNNTQFDIKTNINNNENKTTGLIHYENCIEHYCIWDDDYQENPRRYQRIMERLNEMNLIDKCFLLNPRKATINELMLVHSLDYIENIEKISTTIMDPVELEKESSKYDSIYFNNKTFDCSLYACGSVLELIDSIMENRIRNGIAIIRPPGHHAMYDKACGYCIFNNVAIATKYCQQKYHLKRILIVDWDVHHGQATQRTFYNDCNVLYVSIHRYENGKFWPELIESNYNFCGNENNNSYGYNINVPLNDIRLTDTDYLSIWHNLLLPIFYQFNPELILVSAGYDAAIGCPEGEMLLSPSIYGHFTHYLMGLANGKVGIILEGGYCLESLAESVCCTVQTLIGLPPILLTTMMKYPINKSVIETVLNVISVHRSEWNLLCIQRTFNRHDPHLDDNEEQAIRKRHYPTLEYLGNIDLIPKTEGQIKYPTRDCYPKQTQEHLDKTLLLMKFLRERMNERINSNDWTKRTCLIKSSDLSHRHQAPKTHPERSNRIKYLWRLLKTNKILDKCLILDNNQSASDEQIAICHTYLEQIAKTKTMNYKELRDYEQKFDSLYLTNDSFMIAKLSIGALLQMVDCVVRNECLNGFACIRPPGHHAKKNEPAGFCLFNQIAIAAYYAIEKYGLKRILIIDWDIHHGDGTQDIVMNDERILFISIHRFDNGEFYPENPTASNYRTGSKNIINIPWNGSQMGDREYLSTFFNIIMPVAYNFDPQLVLVSCGFDAAENDPLGEYHITSAAYGHMTHLLCSLANGKIILSLEGGYHLQAIANSAIECIRVLLNEPPKPLSFNDDDDDGGKQSWQLDTNAIETIRNVIDYHCDYWPCFVYNIDIANNNVTI